MTHRSGPHGSGQGTNDDGRVVVIGSGLGGLTTAASLAAAGRAVVVVEHHDLAGGNSQVFRRGDCEFDVGIHYVGDCGEHGPIPMVLHGLGVEDRVHFRELDPDGFDVLQFPEGSFRVPRGWAAYRRNFVEWFPDEGDAFDGYASVLRSIGSQWGSFLVGGPADAIDQHADDTLGELFDRFGFSPRARAVLAHLAGTYGCAPSRASVLVHALLVTHYVNGAYYPEGGGQVLAARLVEVIEAFGGEVRTLTLAEAIEIEVDPADGRRRVTGVRVRPVHGDGASEVLAATTVVSNADLRRTMLDLVGSEHLAPVTVERIRSAEMALGLICLYVVVDIDLSDRLPNANLLVFDSDDLDAVCEPLERGERPTDVPFAYFSFASLKDPGNARLCPPGHTNFQVMTLAPRGYRSFGLDAGPADGARYRRDETYRELKQWYTDRLLDHAERALGPIRDHLVHVECATPVTHERYTRSTEGTSYGFAHTPEQSGRRRPPCTTEIDGLHLVGAGTVGLHGIAGVMAGGVLCAGEILGRPLLAEMMLGERLVDPAGLPPFDAAADPVEISRGAVLRARRAGVAAPVGATR